MKMTLQDYQLPTTTVTVSDSERFDSINRATEPLFSPLSRQYPYCSTIKYKKMEIVF